MGNCVDKWIEKRLDISLVKILKLRSSLKSRCDQRDKEIDYFNTGCYEYDYSTIINIRDNAQLLVENCNKFLERISEQYSKLN